MTMTTNITKRGQSPADKAQQYIETVKTGAKASPVTKPRASFSPLYFIHTLWLFTASDHMTFIFPQAVFGIIGALAGPLLTRNNAPDLLIIVQRMPHVIFWTWLNNLVFALANQRLPESAAEDRLNKPWRPLPAARITVLQARRLLLVALPTTLAIIYSYLGAAEETVMLFCLTWMYNDLGGSDEDLVTRNLMIAVATSLYDCGALRVACGHDQQIMIPKTYCWFTMVAGVTFTTIQIQDFKDKDGDRSRDRQTAPLVLGDSVARLTVAIPVSIWSLACPMFWGLGIYGSSLSIGLGIIVAVRVLSMKERSADRTTWKLWSYWIASLHLLPIYKDYSVFDRLWR